MSVLPESLAIGSANLLSGASSLVRVDGEFAGVPTPASEGAHQVQAAVDTFCSAFRVRIQTHAEALDAAARNYVASDREAGSDIEATGI